MEFHFKISACSGSVSSHWILQIPPFQISLLDWSKKGKGWCVPGTKDVKKSWNIIIVMQLTIHCENCTTSIQKVPLKLILKEPFRFWGRLMQKKGERWVWVMRNSSNSAEMAGCTVPKEKNTLPREEERDILACQRCGITHSFF